MQDILGHFGLQKTTHVSLVACLVRLLGMVDGGSGS